jgi:hypothetical protein
MMQTEILRNYGYGDDITTRANMQILLEGVVKASEASPRQAVGHSGEGE